MDANIFKILLALRGSVLNSLDQPRSQAYLRRGSSGSRDMSSAVHEDAFVWNGNKDAVRQEKRVEAVIRFIHQCKVNRLLETSLYCNHGADSEDYIVFPYH